MKVFPIAFIGFSSANRNQVVNIFEIFYTTINIIDRRAWESVQSRTFRKFEREREILHEIKRKRSKCEFNPIKIYKRSGHFFKK